MNGWSVYQHKPTRVQAIPFTPATRDEIRERLTALFGPASFSMTDTQLVLHTAQGDSRDILIGTGWVIIRRRNGVRNRWEPYPVNNEVMNDYDRVLPGHRRRLFGRRPR